MSRQVLAVGALVVLGLAAVLSLSLLSDGERAALVRGDGAALEDRRGAAEEPTLETPEAASGGAALGSKEGPARVGASAFPVDVHSRLAGAAVAPELGRSRTQIIDLEAEPVGSIAFELREAEADVDDPPLARGRTDSEGFARLLVPGVKRPLTGLVTEPGYMSLEAESGAGSPDALLPLRLDLQLRRGASARGQVYDRDGRPYETSVQAYDWGTEGILQKAPLTVQLLGGGRFRVDYERNWSGVLHARSSRGVGSSAVELSLLEVRSDLALHLVGDGTLRGRVLDARGEPIKGLRLFALLAELEECRATSRWAPLASRYRAEGGGRIWAWSVPDARGAFVFEGLRPDRYVIRAGEQLRGFEHPLVLTPAPVLADGRSLELVLAAPRLVVRLLNAKGEPLENEARPAAERGGGSSVGPSVRVHSRDANGRIVTESLQPISEAGASPIVYAVQPGEQLYVAVVGEGFDGRFETVQVPAAGGGVELVRRAGPVEEGLVEVSVTTVEGDPPALALLSLVDPVLGLALHSTDRPNARWSVAPGRYFVVVTSARAMQSLGSGLAPENLPAAHAWSAVEVRAGEETSVELQLERVGYLELELRGEPDDADRAGVALPIYDELDARAEIDRAARCARVFLRAQGGPEFELIPSAGSAWPLGQRLRSDGVPAGRYELVARLPGGREVRREVEITALETRALQLGF